MSKLRTQRKRRIRMAHLESIKRSSLRDISIDDTHRKETSESREFSNEHLDTSTSKFSRTPPIFNKLQITPGTPFMIRLKEALCFYACARLQRNRRYSNIEFYISGGDVPGEGEVKIMERIYFLASQDNRASQASYMIFGSDADIVVMGIASQLQNIFVLTSGSKSRTYYCFSIWKQCLTFLDICCPPQFLQLEMIYRIRFDFVNITNENIPYFLL